MAYRFLFSMAAAYNIAFGLWAIFCPLHFFRLFDLDPPRYPSLWGCLGMVVGVYGLAYAHVAWKPEQGDVLIAIGLLGKVLGPIGWVHAVRQGELPPRTFPLILANDLIWWFPFLFYLWRGSRNRPLVVAWTVILVHLAACVALLAVSGGTETEPDLAERARWVAGHPAAWTAAWVVWALASMSLLAFMSVWSARLLVLGAPRMSVLASCALCATGVLFDLSGETVNIVWLTRPGQDVTEFARGARLYTILGPGIANGLYCIAGLALSALSWRVGFVRRAVGVLGFCMWSVGLALTACAFLDDRIGMVVTGGLVMLLFLPWAALLSGRLR